MTPKVESVTDNRLILGEGPHWDVQSQSLYFVDCSNKSILRYVPATGELYEAIVGDGKISIVIPVEGTKDQFLITLDNKIAVVTWDGKSPQVEKKEILLEVEKDLEGNSFNDGRVDSSGRLWIGTMGIWQKSKELGSLYSLVSRNTLKKHADKITASNGITFDENLKKLYHIDTADYIVYSYDFNSTKGEIGNRKIVFNFKDHDIPGLPDGMTIDAEGKLWVACVTGSQIIRIDPLTSKLLATIKIPSFVVTSMAFGGPNLDVLYVTTGTFKVEGEDSGPYAGSIVKITGLGVKGLAANKVKL